MATVKKRAESESPAARSSRSSVAQKKIAIPVKPAALKSSRTSEPEIGELRPTADETRLFLFPVDPYRLFSYWLIRQSDLDKMLQKLQRKYQQLTPVIRFYDITGITFTGSNALGSFDIPVDLHAGKCYVRLWRAGRHYVADLGLKNEFSIFYPLVRSNHTELPADPFVKEESPSLSSDPVIRRLSERIDQDFMPGISSHAASPDM